MRSWRSCFRTSRPSKGNLKRVEKRKSPTIRPRMWIIVGTSSRSWCSC